MDGLKLNQGSLIAQWIGMSLKKIEEWEYPNNTRGKRMPEINSMKGNTLNKLKEGDARNETQVIGHVLKRTHRIESWLLETKGTYE